MDKFFPIKVEPACQLKWAWSTVRLRSGRSSSCHRVNPVDVDDFSNFHNTPEIVNDRKLMLEGKWPDGRGCEFCRLVEEAGGTSDRMFQKQIPNLYPKELDQDINATVVTPTILEVYFDNACNMACLYCHSGFSSRIEAENNKFGRYNEHGIVIENREEFSEENRKTYAEQFWEWMESNYDELKRMHILGGEPFFQKDFDRCLDFLESRSNPDLEFNVITNLKVSKSKLEQYVKRFKRLVAKRKLKRFDVTASIDCFGKAGEYVRYGLDLEQWKENFEYLVENKWIHLQINQALSCLTIKTIPELIEYINQFEGRNIGQYFSPAILTHRFLHPSIFDYSVFEKDFENILSTMQEDTWQQQKAKANMEGVIARLKKDGTHTDAEEVKKLKIFLDEIDRRRGLNWKETFPWLAEFK